MCSKKGRSKTGGCPWDDTEGIYMQKKMTYPGAVLHTPMDDLLRQRWKQEFKGREETKAEMDERIKESKEGDPKQRTTKGQTKGKSVKSKPKKVVIPHPYKHLWDKPPPIRMTVRTANEAADKVQAARLVACTVFTYLPFPNNNT